MTLRFAALAGALVAFIVTLLTMTLSPHVRVVVGQAPASITGAAVPDASATYVGSATCRSCHLALYERWSQTRMANVVRDPREHPDVVLPDFSKPDPLKTFALADVALVYGSKWKQRYFTKVGDNYFPLPAQWDVSHRVWRAYFVQPNTDWWVPFYPADNMQRPTGPLCDGCHSVNYNVQTKSVLEWNVGCEKCHGPGSEHVRRPGPWGIVNPAKLDYVRANDTCIQCHSQGQPRTKPILGRYYDWPVGFHQGGRLNDFWTLEESTLGKGTFTHFADGTAHKNRMQGNDFVQSEMYTHGVTCFSCHDVHGNSNDADLVKPADPLCLTCHGPHSPNGPREASLEAHTHHAGGSAGSACIACHMAKIEQTIADVNVRSHTFRFITPAMTDQYKIPNPCNGCHTDRTTEWAREALAGWSGQSPWRVN